MKQCDMIKSVHTCSQKIISSLGVVVSPGTYIHDCTCTSYECIWNGNSCDFHVGMSLPYKDCRLEGPDHCCRLFKLIDYTQNSAVISFYKLVYHAS